ncbi:DUF2231 domain-containing protein [Desulfurispira natronophila]|uniref:Putative heme/steroid binding protein n=1 Tax=Desulfurispira natronophila TaxID=682562 RepID=A0A7W7Y5C1_9BACT|nr:DUF2231 domain-containing protein [Desulfurispira natronophila]MBB5022092.1 putative heme/steroid binding protein [Desulfurispira natronophila]
MKLDELKHNDGQDGRSAYVGYDGKVYDVTKSRMWKNGVHARVHKAGEDLTQAMKSAPHGPEVFEGFAEVGQIEVQKNQAQAQEQDPLERWQQWYRKYHPHPMFIHFPIGLLNFAILMYILYLVTGAESLETTAFHAMAVMVISIIPSVASGWFSWKVNYLGAWNRIFAVKTFCSAILFTMALIVVLIRLSFPEVAFGSGGLFWLYTLLFFGQLPVSGAIGYYGGKLTWQS